ncbi:pentapeptide repeat-containing protein [Leptolyngbya sp. FACHB-261]|uniref:pentapeptide repeat-containing protein n=1 Tax=Leptolyngbya sp. FACHB-261 TaxID=2692806 RepID=UPI0016896C0F|nr:pentapeptide repeat-containing protein [Leptolyngbya sp. FACHB-261]MBD2102934.1 pentapeptide repeat-containing protein [Leptolyngbya sp. FACHB-261]
MNDLDRCYILLGLEPGASQEEVNQAYKDLAFVWHPDRVPKDNPRLLEKAQEKLKEINWARDQLRAHQKAPVRAQAQTAQPKSNSKASARPSQTYYHYQSPHHHQTSQKAPQPQQQARRHSDLSGADLRGANLKEKDLSGRNLSNADLSNANLSDAFLHNVNLTGANLHGANLFRANLLQARLNNANLQEANLIGADLSGADLSGADLRGACIGSPGRVMVKLTGANLMGTTMPDGSLHQ